MPLEAPIAGKIISVNHIQGEHLDAHQELFRIVNTEHIWVEASVSEFDLAELLERRVVGSGDLHQAEQRPKCGLAHELGVDRDKVRARKARAKSREVVGTDDRFHDPIIGIVTWICPPANRPRSRTLTRAAIPCAFPLARGRP